ncbi:hypothetical protein NQ318_004324, partial [Aromia moschata]
WSIGLVRFSNDVCTSLEGFDGTCYTSSQCDNVGGIASGTCALNDIGVCCTIQKSCGESSSLNNTYFFNSGFPSTVAGGTQCTFTIIPCNTNICEIRLDFLSFTLAQPDGNGYCVTDSFVVTGSGSNVPILCGENTGQHIYLMVNNGSNIQLTISTSSSVTLGRSWSIKVTQIACDCPTLAPIGCLQFYTEESDTVTSFNYGTTINGALVTWENGTTRPGSRQLANQNYGICVNMIPGYCGIQWSQSSDDTSFTVSNNTALVAVTPGLPGEGIIGENCTTDFVVIPNPYYANGTAVAGDRFCGNQFPTVTTYSKPFVLTVITNDNELDDVANRGFSLDYTQLACSSNLAVIGLLGR